MEFVWALMLLAFLAVAVVAWQRNRRASGVSDGGAPDGGFLSGSGGRGAAELTRGTLVVTSATERQPEGDRDGNRFVTLVGTIVGDARPVEVYGRFVIGRTDRWPQAGDELPVAFKPGKAETTWRLVAAD